MTPDIVKLRLSFFGKFNKPQTKGFEVNFADLFTPFLTHLERTKLGKPFHIVLQPQGAIAISDI